MAIEIDKAIKAYIGMRDAIAEKNREAKEYAATLKDDMNRLELYIHKLLNDMKLDSFKAKGVGTAFIAMKDSVTISDKEGFKSFIAAKLLFALQKHHYKTGKDEWQPEGEIDLKEHVDMLLNAGVFDLLTVAANKNNCKTFMAEHDGSMPDGVEYFKENVVQFRKGK